MKGMLYSMAESRNLAKNKGIDGPCRTLAEFAEELNVPVYSLTSIFSNHPEICPKVINRCKVNYYSYKGLKLMWKKYQEIKKAKNPPKI